MATQEYPSLKTSRETIAGTRENQGPVPTELELENSSLRRMVVELLEKNQRLRAQMAAAVTRRIEDVGEASQSAVLA